MVRLAWMDGMACGSRVAMAAVAAAKIWQCEGQKVEVVGLRSVKIGGREGVEAGENKVTRR